MPELGTPLVNTHHRPRRCRESRRWPQRAGTCHWQHSNQRAGRHTSHPGKGQVGSKVRERGEESGKELEPEQETNSVSSPELEASPSLGQDFSLQKRHIPCAQGLTETCSHPAALRSLCNPSFQHRAAQRREADCQRLWGCFRRRKNLGSSCSWK